MVSTDIHARVAYLLAYCDCLGKQVSEFSKISQPPRWFKFFLLMCCFVRMMIMLELSPKYLVAHQLLLNLLFMDLGRERNNNEGGRRYWSKSRYHFWADYELGQCSSIPVSHSTLIYFVSFPVQLSQGKILLATICREFFCIVLFQGWVYYLISWSWSFIFWWCLYMEVLALC